METVAATATEYPPESIKVCFGREYSLRQCDAGILVHTTRRGRPYLYLGTVVDRESLRALVLAHIATLTPNPS